MFLTTVTFYGNDMYGSGPSGARSTDRDAPSSQHYSPLSARSFDGSSPAEKSATGARPPSRLGTSRGAVSSSKFSVPRLDLTALRQNLQQGDRPAAPHAPTNQSAAGRNVAAQRVPIAESAGAMAASTAPLGRPRTSSGTAARPRLQATTFKVDLASLEPERPPPPPSSTSLETAGKENADPRPSPRLGRPLSSKPSPVADSTGTNPAHASLESSYPHLMRQKTTHSEADTNGAAHRPSSGLPPDFSIKAVGASGPLQRTTSTSSLPRPSVEATAAWVAASKSFVMTPKGGRGSSFSSSGHHKSDSGAGKQLAVPVAPANPKLGGAEAAKKFLMAPGPINEAMKCRVGRAKSGMWGAHDQVRRDTMAIFSSACPSHQSLLFPNSFIFHLHGSSNPQEELTKSRADITLPGICSFL